MFLIKDNSAALRNSLMGRPDVRVCADIAFGLGARIEGWSTRPQEKARKERRRKKKKPFASHHHRKNLLFPSELNSPSYPCRKYIAGRMAVSITSKSG